METEGPRRAGCHGAGGRGVGRVAGQQGGKTSPKFLSLRLNEPRMNEYRCSRATPAEHVIRSGANINFYFNFHISRLSVHPIVGM